MTICELKQQISNKDKFRISGWIVELSMTVFPFYVDAIVYEETSNSVYIETLTPIQRISMATILDGRTLRKRRDFTLTEYLHEFYETEEEAMRRAKEILVNKLKNETLFYKKLDKFIKS